MEKFLYKCPLCNKNLKSNKYWFEPFMFWYEFGTKAYVPFMLDEVFGIWRFYFCKEDVALYRRSPDTSIVLMESKLRSLLKGHE